jgi:hypothetical protein
MDGDQLAAKVKKIPPIGWVAIAAGGVFAWRWYSARQVAGAPADPAATDPLTDGYGTSISGANAGTGGTDVTNNGSGGSGKPTFDSNAEWISAATDVLVARGFSAGFAQTALTKAVDGEPLSVQEKAAVSLALALLGVGPPGGMPPLGSDPAPPPGGGNPPPAPKPTTHGPATRKAAGAAVISANTKGSAGRWTWEQVMREFYSNTPPPGAATTKALSQLKAANMWRVIPKGHPGAGKKNDGWGGWVTVGGNVTVSLPSVLWW